MTRKYRHPAVSADDDDNGVAEPTPSYEDAIATAKPRRPDQPPRLALFGATWGGVNVTDDIRAMVSANETVKLDFRNLHHVLQPDPARGLLKTLSVLYQYEDQDGLHLLNATEHESPILVAHTTHESPATPKCLHTLDRPWRANPYGAVEILAVLYGPQRIETPSVLQELANFFDGRRGQIRMTNAFFKADPWPNHKKSWAVYFRFIDSKRIQCVTGMEDGALEVPWSRR
ncbi:hypothetical protein B0T17DRAFT_492307 [Bombardia bombarda]|uniref:Uncharacterized protein n=1 Tax=Bombardia bombarda TaxID=252184 RepID=A0AA39X1F4_9PEZI|nr:hypothetical protein B0T17DRAFT_492307 [Bombardia bombarda]